MATESRIKSSTTVDQSAIVLDIHHKNFLISKDLGRSTQFCRISFLFDVRIDLSIIKKNFKKQATMGWCEVIIILVETTNN